MSLSMVVTHVLASSVVIFMVTASIETRVIQSQYDFRQPFLLVYFSTSCMMLFYPLLYLYHLRYSKTHYQQLADIDADSSLNTEKQPQRSAFLEFLLSHFENFSLKKIFLLAVPFSFLWMSANYTFTLALSLTDVATAIALEQSATFFVFILSVLILKESVTLFKVISTLLCFGGVILISIGDSESLKEPNHTISQRAIGDIIVLITACSSALYMVFFAKYLKTVSSSLVSVCVWLGSIGCVVFLTCWPIVIMLSVVKLEKFYLPQNGITYLLIFSQALASILFNYFLNFGILKLSPLYMRIVTICSMPLSFIVEIIWFKQTYTYFHYLGSAVIIIGYVIFSVTSLKQTPAQSQTQS